MNKEKAQILKSFQPSSVDKLEKVLGHEYPMALWRMPNQDEIQAIIDLRPDQTSDASEIESMDPGFAINAFQHHHPSQPNFIKADLLISWKKNKDLQIKTNPVIKDQELENFDENISQSKKMVGYQPRIGNPDYRFSVKTAVEAIKQHQFNKVVLSRYEDRSLPGNFNVFTTFAKACDAYPNAFVYLVYAPELGTWLGATPETLISVKDKRYFTTASLAGTQKLLPDQPLSSVPWTQKEIEEQAMVSRYIIDCLKKIRLREFEEVGPKTIKAGNLAHLKTEYHIDMKEVNMSQLPSVMLDLLHPTSAVCGMPLQPSLEFIREHEQYDRELYAGFLGPVNIHNLTHLFVNLRCMKIINQTGRFYAGAGITEDSDPEKEYIETQMKMETLKKLIF